MPQPPNHSLTNSPVQPIDTTEEKKEISLPLLIGVGVTIIVVVGCVVLAITVKNVLSNANHQVTFPDEVSTAIAGPTVTIASATTSIPTSAAASAPILSPETKQLAEAGVTHNTDWTPYTQEINGVPMALVPAGCFMVGTTDEQAKAWCTALWGPDERCDLESFDSERPAHEVCFEEPFWIDVYEVTNKVFGSVGCEWLSSNPDQPRNCVIWEEAQAHCEARGARLPTGPNGNMQHAAQTGRHIHGGMNLLQTM